MKPFDLEAALRGEPVKLRCGDTAIVGAAARDDNPVAGTRKELIGWNGNGAVMSWRSNGTYSLDYNTESMDDIIGMAPRTRQVNGFTVPTPVKETPEDLAVLYTAIPSNRYWCGSLTWYAGDDYCERALGRGILFDGKEAAIANAKAMCGIDPEWQP